MAESSAWNLNVFIKIILLLKNVTYYTLYNYITILTFLPHMIEILTTGADIYFEMVEKMNIKQIYLILYFVGAILFSFSFYLAIFFF